MAPRSSRRKLMRVTPRQSAPLTLNPQLQIQLSYRQAQKHLGQLRQNWVTTPRELAHLQPVVKGLARMHSKLDQGVLHMAVLGLVGRGKSSLLNALLGDTVFATGAIHGVTRRLEVAPWYLPEPPQLAPGNSASGDDRSSPTDLDSSPGPAPGLMLVEVWDTPGLDEINGGERERLARRVAQRADLILFVISSDLSQVEYETLLTLRQACKPLLLVFNKVDQYPELDREAIYAKLHSDRLRDLISPDEIILTAAAPVERRAVRQANGQVVVQQTLALPQVQALRDKILDLLRREGLALLTLNSLLYAQRAKTHIIQQKLKLRATAAEDTIWQSSVAKAMAIALNPVPIVDVMAGSLFDVQLIVRLSQIYGLPLSRWGAWRMLRIMGLSMAALSGSELLTGVGLGALKGILVGGLPASGGATLTPYLSIALTQGVVAGLASHVVGKTAQAYLAEGAQWGEADTRSSMQRILDHLDRDSILVRLRQELQRKIQHL